MTTALSHPDRPRPPGDHGRRTHHDPLDEFVADPAGLTPACDEPEFTALLEEMVADEAPRLFAVVQEYGDRVDGQIVAWGMAFDDRAEVVSVGRTRRMSLPAPENALRLFEFGSHLRARVVWVNPDAATPVDDDDEAT